ncbi:MAG TPA: TRAP transporter large permease subunit [Burkholderiaceae bacterium]|nr:TRAP transporter large permease subunit [Burkholderiaceae bacterium]
MVSRLGLSPVMVVSLICAIYVVLGTAMEELSMVLLTMPVFFPVVVQLGFDPVWFGIIVVMVVELGLITPPIGMNVFVMGGVARDIPLKTIFRGIVPFLYADFVRLALLILFPGIALFLLKK